MVIQEAKTTAIISYIGFIGWIIALIINSQKKTEFGSFHLRQSLFIHIAWLVLMWVPFVKWFAWVIFVIFIILGIIAAANGEKKELPFVGSLASEWFKGI